jgi:hypothetical protein
MKSVNSLSGGKTSSYIALNYPADYNVFSLVCIDDHRCKPKDNAIIKYVNDKLIKYNSIYGDFIATAEDDKTLKVMMDLEQLMGKEIIWVRGRSFDQIIDEGSHTRLPSWARRYCTVQMKIEPIFYWWFNYIGEKINMRIGFRRDEYERMERFFNNSNPNYTKIPIYCKNYGSKQQKMQEFNWRYCSFPLIKDDIYKKDVDSFWEKKGFVGGDLFEERRQIDFPIVSNCVGCFHKKPETLCIMSNLHPEKMNWFAEQEVKEMGTWLDSKVPYFDLIKFAKDGFTEDVLNEFGASCDSGGCHD